MKLSSRKQLLSESDAELRRMRKLAGLTESHSTLKSLLFEGPGFKDSNILGAAYDMTPEEFDEAAVQMLIDGVSDILDRVIYNINRGKNSAGEPIPKTVQKNKAKVIATLEKEKKFIISKIKSQKLKSMDSLKSYFLGDFTKKLKALGFEE